MSTRNLTVFKESKDGTEIVVMYRQCDGYPTGIGAELLGRLRGVRVVNGLSGDYSKIVNGPGCLAATVVAAMKDGPGGVYLHPAGTRDCGEKYVYTLWPSSDRSELLSTRGSAEIMLRVVSCPDEMLYEGPLDAFDPEAAEAKIGGAA